MTRLAGKLGGMLSIGYLRGHLRTPLYANAYFLMASTAIGSLLGFVFWTVAARLCAPDEVGIASALISALVFLTGLSGLGLGIGLIRFLPGAGEASHRMLNSSVTLVTLASLAIATIFLAGLPLWSPALRFMYDEPLLLTSFVLVVLFLTWGELLSQVFVAHRAARLTLFRSAAMGVLKILLVILLATCCGALGIYASVVLAVAVSSGIAFLWFLPSVQKGYVPRPRLHAKILHGLVPYSLGNYVAAFLTQTSLIVIVLPIMVLNVLGAKESAYTYMAWMVANMLFVVSGAISTSTFAESSNEEGLLGVNVRKAWRLTLLLLAPAILLTLLMGGRLLLVFGKDYAQEGAGLLTILALSALPVAVNNIYFAIKRVTKEVGLILVLSLFIVGSTLGWSYFLMPRYGIVGTGFGWLLGQGMVSGFVAFSLLKRAWPGFRRSAKDLEA